MNRPLSPHPTLRQAQALHVIQERIERKGVPPSIRELCRAMAIRSTNAGNDFLKALERKGLIERDTMQARGLRITRRGHSYLAGGAR